MVPWLSEPLKTILQRGSKGTIDAVRVRDESVVPFRWISEYWRIHDMEGTAAGELRFQRAVMIDRVTHDVLYLPSDLQTRTNWNNQPATGHQPASEATVIKPIL